MSSLVVDNILKVINDHYDPITGTFDTFKISVGYNTREKFIIDSENNDIIKSIVEKLKDCNGAFTIVKSEANEHLEHHHIFIEINNKLSVKVYFMIKEQNLEIYAFRLRNEPMACIYNYSKKMIGVPREKNMQHDSDYINEPIIGHIGTIPIIPIMKINKNKKSLNLNSDNVWTEDVLIFDSYKDLKMRTDQDDLKWCLGRLLYWSDNSYTVLEDLFGTVGDAYIVLSYDGFYIPKIVYTKYEALKKEHENAEESAKIFEKFLPTDVIVQIYSFAYKVFDADVSYESQKFKYSEYNVCEYCANNDNGSYCDNCTCDRGIKEYNETTKKCIDREDPFLVQAVLESSQEERTCKYSCLYVDRYPKKFRASLKHKDSEYISLKPY